MIVGTYQSIPCPTWHRPILRVVPGGIEIKCKFCQGRPQFISKEELERHWQALQQPETDKEVLNKI